MKWFVLAIALASPVAAQNIQTLKVPCNTRQSVIAQLATKYTEEIRVQAMDERGLMLEVFSNSETGTWTATMSNAHGLMCILGAGIGAEFVRETLDTPDF